MQSVYYNIIIITRLTCMSRYVSWRPSTYTSKYE